jgi:hypothetical protein
MNHNIRPAGLPRSPASLKIDKLYIEGGASVVGGFMMDINRKEQPFWLQRKKDYPDLLNWVKLRPIVFYDVEERRAWLVDGASALLHLVRISLHQDTNDTESAYDWVYDSSKLKDNWPGVGGRQAAVSTLKNWDNRALGLHIIGKRPDVNGVLVPEYSTFEDRVKGILHSIAKRVTIVAAKETSNPCNCLKQQGSNTNHLSVAECYHKPVQFLTKRWWLLGALPNGLVPVRLGSLPVRGAVILGHTVLGLSSKDASMSRQPDDDGSGSTTTGRYLQATGSSSNVTEMTTITAPSVGPSSQEASEGGHSSNSASNKMDGTRKKRWSKFKDWVKK